jgi:CPA2 family monovalent cation:H+ antiporter-2
LRLYLIFLRTADQPGSLPPVAIVAAGLGAVTALNKVATGYWAAARAGIGRAGCRRAGLALVARGEFSIVIAGFGAAIEPRLGPLAAASAPLELRLIHPFVREA